jgi:acylphosphatase
VTKPVRVVVRGRVQGVGYRMWAVSRASGHGLTGWARNLGDGAVEMMLCGDGASIAAMLADCWTGPPMAEVASVSSQDASPEQLAPGAGQGGFIVLPNG